MRLVIVNPPKYLPRLQIRWPANGVPISQSIIPTYISRISCAILVYKSFDSAVTLQCKVKWNYAKYAQHCQIMCELWHGGPPRRSLTGASGLVRTHTHTLLLPISSTFPSANGTLFGDCLPFALLSQVGCVYRFSSSFYKQPCQHFEKGLAILIVQIKRNFTYRFMKSG